MTRDLATDNVAGSDRNAPRRPYVPPRLTDYGSVVQLTRSLASGSFSDATHMSAANCSGNCS
jgi:hypothetical protein